MVVLATANLVGANLILHLGGRQHSWNLVISSLRCTQGFVIFLRQSIAGVEVTLINLLQPTHLNMQYLKVLDLNDTQDAGEIIHTADCCLNSNHPIR